MMTPDASSAPPEQAVAQLHSALQRGDATAVRTVLQAHPSFRSKIDEPLFSFNAPAIVAFARSPALVEVLLDFGADPNRRSEWWAGGFHPLHSATGRAADLLLAAGAEVDACAAANLDRLDLLEALLERDPLVVNDRGGDGQTPLHFARSRAAVDLLLAAGADVDARDLDHRGTPAEWMLDGGPEGARYEMARYLVVEHGAAADIFMTVALGLTDRALNLLAADPALMRVRTGRGAWGEDPPSSYHIYMWSIGEGRSPLDVAMQFGQMQTLEALLERAAATERLTFFSRLGDAARATALVEEDPELITRIPAEDHRLLADAAWAGSAPVVALMLELGFDPNVPGQDGGTALHCAAWQGSAETVELLLHSTRGRESIHTTDPRHNATPLGWCCHGSRFGPAGRDHGRVAELLLDAGSAVGPDCTHAAPPVRRVIDKHLPSQPA